MKKNEGLRVLAADVISEGLLVHFSNNMAVLFQANFLFECREQGGSVLMPEQGDGIPGH